MLAIFLLVELNFVMNAFLLAAMEAGLFDLVLVAGFVRFLCNFIIVAWFFLLGGLGFESKLFTMIVSISI